MNWYVERNGVSEGPLSELELMGRAKRDEIQSDTLIWNPGLTEWKSVSELRPDWLQPAPAPVAPTAEPPPARPATKPLAPSKQTDEEKPGFFKRLFGGKKK